MPCRDLVVIGGSAGSFEALRTILAGLSPTFPAAIFVVVHIPAYGPSILPEILGAVTRLPVTHAVEGEPIEPGRVYVAGPDHHLMVEESRIRVTHGPKENRFRPSVDVLFRSAAYVYGPRVIGVILSGMLDDGTAGLWTVKDRGGLALIQDIQEAQHPSMPQNARRAVEVDYELPVAEMPALLMRLTAEPMPFMQETPMPERLPIETRIALEDNAFEMGVLQLGAPSVYTCPECHGVLVQIQEGNRVRYRCHTGHAYSHSTLLASVTESIEESLWSAVRVMEEKVLLLRQIEKEAHAMQDASQQDAIAKQIEGIMQQIQEIREIALYNEDMHRQGTQNDMRR